MSNPPVDQATRDQALDPQASFHLEAPAGSGKTSVLLARYLNLLARVEAPEDILALTFTRKAAGELRERLVKSFWDRTAPAPDAPAVDHLIFELAQKAFRHLDRQGLNLAQILVPERFQILTFHALCAKLLASAPHEAGVPLDFRLLEDTEVEWLKSESLEELRRRLAQRPESDAARQSLRRRLLRLNNDWPRLAEELGTLISRRDCLGEFLALAQASRDLAAYRELTDARLGQLLAPDLQALAQGLAATRLGREWEDFVGYLRKREAPLGDTLPGRLPGTGLEELPLWQTLARAFLTKEGAPRKMFSRKEGFPADFANSPWSQAVKEIPPDLARRLFAYQDIPPPMVYADEVAALQDLVILLGEALAVYDELCRQRQALDFIALEAATLRLLEEDNPSELLLRLDCRFQHLLVDEFQDTSLNQKELLCRLLEGWDPGGGRTLTVVGDPRQSIYGWRNARVRLFLEARRGLSCQWGRLPLKPLSLTTNFRASRRLITWVNQVFGQTVLRAFGPQQVPFAPADPAPGAEEGEWPELVLFLGADPQMARQAEARWLAAQVAHLSSRPGSRERVGILLFARTHLATYLSALQEAGQAVLVQEGLKLADSRVVQHLHNLARALIRPHDDLAWATVLVGPWAREPLATVAQAASLAEASWPRRLAVLAQEASCPPRLRPVLAAILAAREETGRRPLEEILRQFLDEAGAWAGIAALEGALGVANANAYLDILARAESGLPEVTFQKTEISLAQAFQPPDPRAQDSPVEIMTVHGAKGLEFDRVFLPFLDWQPLANQNKTPPFLLEEIPAARHHALALAPPYWQQEKTLLYRSLKNLHDDRVLNEARRVFYVAATRARKRLCFSGVIPLKDGVGQPGAGPSPLNWLLAHYRQEAVVPGNSRWADPCLKVTVLPEGPAAPLPYSKAAPSLPDPWVFSPERLPYRLTYPTQAGEGFPPAGGHPEEGLAPDGGGAAGWLKPDDRLARLRGEVVHRLLETAFNGGRLPDQPGVAAALRRQGLSPGEAAALAGEILTEVRECLADPFLARVAARTSASRLSERLLEAVSAPGVIRRGRLDLLVNDDDGWLLVDFKTSRPPTAVPWEEFVAWESQRYRPQLLAYRDMVAGVRGLEPHHLRLALYFTACRRLVAVD